MRSGSLNLLSLPPLRLPGRSCETRWTVELEAPLEYVYQLFSKELAHVREQIEECRDLEQKATLIGNKNLLNYSIKLLKKCEKYGIHPNSIFTQLPAQKCESPSSDYRIVEDCETEDRRWWVEVNVEIGGTLFDVRLHGGDVVIQV